MPRSKRLRSIHPVSRRASSSFRLNPDIDSILSAKIVKRTPAIQPGDLVLHPDAEKGVEPRGDERVNSIHVPIRWLVKCGLFTLVITAMYALALYLFRLEAVAEEFAGYSNVMVFGLLVLGNVTFLAFDRVLARFSALYQEKRKR